MSLDIVNVFNSLPWRAIRAALRRHQVPHYFRRVVESHLSDRRVEYPGSEGAQHERRVSCGVPQRSVLGPTLWDIAYDTLVLATGKDFGRTLRLAECVVACVVAWIDGLGLKIAPQKTEAVWFYGSPAYREHPQSFIRVGQSRVGVGSG